MVKTPPSNAAGVQVQSLVKEPRVHLPHSVAKRLDRKKKWLVYLLSVGESKNEKSMRVCVLGGGCYSNSFKIFVVYKIGLIFFSPF